MVESRAALIDGATFKWTLCPATLKKLMFMQTRRVGKIAYITRTHHGSRYVMLFANDSALISNLVLHAGADAGESLAVSAI